MRKGIQRYGCPFCPFKCFFNALVGPAMPAHIDENESGKSCPGSGAVPIRAKRSIRQQHEDKRKGATT